MGREGQTAWREVALAAEGEIDTPPVPRNLNPPAWPADATAGQHGPLVGLVLARDWPAVREYMRVEAPSIAPGQLLVDADLSTEERRAVLELLMLEDVRAADLAAAFGVGPVQISKEQSAIAERWGLNLVSNGLLPMVGEYWQHMKGIAAEMRRRGQLLQAALIEDRMITTLVRTGVMTQKRLGQQIDDASAESGVTVAEIDELISDLQAQRDALAQRAG